MIPDCPNCLCTLDGHIEPCDECMRPVVFALVGPSGSGKTTLARKVVEALHPRIRPLQSVTTRPRRPDDHENYEFIDQSVFSYLESTDKLAQVTNYAGHSYGTRLAEIFNDHRPGIYAVTEEGLKQLKQNKAIKTVGIRVSPMYHDYMPSRVMERYVQDVIRHSDEHIDYVVINRFEAGGLGEAVDKLVKVINHESL